MIKQRLSIIIPAIVLMLVMFGVAVAVPGTAQSLTIAIPVVCVVATGTLFGLERASRIRKQEPTAKPTPKMIRMKRLRVAVLIAAAAFILAMSLLAANQPVEMLPIILTLTVVVAAVAAAVALMLDRRAR